MKGNLMNYKVIDIKEFGDDRGHLASFESGSNCPFDVKRVFYIFDTQSDVSRGNHANKFSEFLLVSVSGSCKVKVDDGKGHTDIVTLDSPLKALYLGNMVWKEMYDFSENAVLMVLASTYYDNSEYIRNYDDFIKMVNKS